jgi:hypothetical protein
MKPYNEVATTKIGDGEFWVILVNLYKDEDTSRRQVKEGRGEGERNLSAEGEPHPGREKAMLRKPGSGQSQPLIRE